MIIMDSIPYILNYYNIPCTIDKTTIVLHVYPIWNTTWMYNSSNWSLYTILLDALKHQC